MRCPACTNYPVMAEDFARDMLFHKHIFVLLTDFGVLCFRRHIILTVVCLVVVLVGGCVATANDNGV